MTFHVYIDGVDRGPAGTGIVRRLTAQVAGKNRLGAASIELTFPSSGGYTFVPTRRVEVWETGATARALFGGIINNYTSTTIEGTNQKIVGLNCVDYNVLLDRLVHDLDSSLEITIAADTYDAQMAQVVQEIQEQGNGTVHTVIDTSAYVTDLGKGEILPSFTIRGKSLRWALDTVVNNLVAALPAVHPRYHLNLMDDGAAGVMVALVSYDDADPPSSKATFSQSPTGGERPIRQYTRALDTSMPLVNRGQSIATIAGAPTGLVSTYEGTASASDYYCDFINHGLSGNKGYWSAAVVADEDSSSSLQAQAYIDRLTRAREFPRESGPLIWDREPSDNLMIVPGDTITLVWDDEGLNTDYSVAGVSVEFPIGSNTSYQRFTFTLGLPKLGLLESPTGGLAAPVIRDVVPPSEAVDFDITSDVFDPNTGRTVQTYAIDPSISNDVAGYEIFGTVNSRNFLVDVGNNLTPSLRLDGDAPYSLQVQAYDGAGNTSGPTPSSPLTGTTDGANHVWDTLPNPGFENLEASGLYPSRWQRSVVGASTIGVTTAAHSGSRAVQLKPADAASNASILSVYAEAIGGRNYGFKFYHMNNGAVTYDHRVHWYDDTLTLISTGTLLNGASGSIATFQPIVKWLTAPAGTIAYKLEFDVVSFGGPARIYTLDSIRVTDFVPRPIGVISTYSSNTTLGLVDHTVKMNAGGGAITATLPSATDPENIGREYIIKKVDSSANKVIVDTTSSQTIDGITSYPLTDQYQGVTVRSNGSSWDIVGQAGLVLNSDGTRWLEGFVSVATWGTDRESAANPYTTSGSGEKCRLSAAHDNLLTRLDLTYYVDGTHSGTHYWTIEIEVHTAGGGFSSLGSWATDKATSIAYVSLSKATSDFAGSGVIAAGDRWIKLKYTKTGNPGNLSVIPRLEYRGIRA